MELLKEYGIKIAGKNHNVKFSLGTWLELEEKELISLMNIEQRIQAQPLLTILKLIYYGIDSEKRELSFQEFAKVADLAEVKQAQEIVIEAVQASYPQEEAEKKPGKKSKTTKS